MSIEDLGGDLAVTTALPSRRKIVILGAGFGGLGMGIKLLKAGQRDFVILERADKVGGTWANNRYPGCACDVPSRLYWPSFVRQPDWSRTFARQVEILAAINAMVEEERLWPHIHLQKTVRQASWNESGQEWTIELNDGKTIQANIFICAVGQLSEPKLPEIPGIKDFFGTVYHTASWPEDAQLTGQRVGVIGTGASAIQVIPELAKVARELRVFQRSAAYVFPRGDAEVSAGERKGFIDHPERIAAARSEILQKIEEMSHALERDSEGAANMIAAAVTNIERQVRDPMIRNWLTPDYPVGCKRPLMSDDYLPTFNLPAVKLITDAIQKITSNGVETRDGVGHQLDTIVFATGFDAQQFLKSIKVFGRGNVSLHNDAWKISPEAHKGITLSGFPGFFLIFGPNTNFFSVLAIMEHQFDFIVKAVELFDRQGVLIEPKPEVQRQYNDWLQTRLQESPFSIDCNNWYRHPSGRVISNWWGALAEYQQLLDNIDPAEYEWVKVHQ